ncbi:alpha/beta hydrolase [Bacillus gobiensis]|uniref:alpha/beta fold hydrolase n=1 Tax=Bacillus gobiensis TaxID=1441095 RepID=UPI003D214009
MQDNRTVQSVSTVINDMNIRYFTAGDKGSPVVFIHGSGLDSASISWSRVLGELAEEFRVFAPDLPGYGQSEKPEVDYTVDYYVAFLEQFLDHINEKEICIVGLSMGGAIALSFALRHPARTKKLVLVSSYGLMQRLPFHPLTAFSIKTAVMEWGYLVLQKSRSRLLTKRVLLSGLICAKEKLSDELLEEVYLASQDPQAGRAYCSFLRSELMEKGLKSNFLERLSEIRMPTLLVQGTKDKTIPLSCAISANESIKNSNLFLLEGCSHWPQNEETDKFNQTVKQFLLYGC